MNCYDQFVHEGCADEFWSALTRTNINGQRVIMPYSEAITTLRARRQQITQEQAADIMNNPSFEEHFSYKRGGKVVSMRKASAIVKRAQLKIMV